MLLIIPAIIILSLVVQLVDGNQRIVYVNESINDDEDFFTSASGISGLISDSEEFFTDDSNSMCCVYGNCSCNSLDHALANLASNVLINITTDVMLFSLIKASNLENVSIIGHNNPTVYCTHAGGIHFNFCYNCIIQDITWDGCGIKTKAAIKVDDCSNVVIEHCSFQYSKGPAIVLSGVSGHVNIGRCNFVHNNCYRGHGAAIHYSSSLVVTDLQLFLAISNCNFTHNYKTAKSLVYIENIISKHNNNITFENTKFIHNQGISIHVVNQNISLLEKILFQNNKAENGAGIYMTDHSTVIFGKSSDVAFIQNSADYNGGAVFLRDHSRIIFDQNSTVTFNDNDATSGTIYSEVNCNVTFQASSEVTFSNNSVQEYGSAIYSKENCHIICTGNSKVTFINNEVRGYFLNHKFTIYFANGGTIYSTGSHISFEKNSITLFKGNVANIGNQGRGGAIYSIGSSISFKENSTTEFTNNNAKEGGAIYSGGGYISFKENSTTKFIYNNAIYGGAIYPKYGFISFEENSITDFFNNIATYGGAIFSSSCFISFKEDSTTEFTNNTAKYNGGAILSNVKSRHFVENFKIISLSFKGNSTTEFTNNTAKHNGGAIYSDVNSISLEENSITEFTNNTAIDGGAICSSVGYITFKEDSTAKFANNFARGNGGAIFSKLLIIDLTNGAVSYDNIRGSFISTIISVSFEGNSTTEFANNFARGSGGAIYTNNIFIYFEGFSDTVFSNNTADYGGALYTVAEYNEYKSAIIYRNIATITFTHNSAPVGETVYCGNNSNVTTKGNSTVIFNNVLPKWCTNMLCTPYTGQGTVTIDSNGIVLCSDQRAFACLSENCNCKSLGDLLQGLTIDHGTIYRHPRAATNSTDLRRNAVISIADKAVLYSFLSLSSLTNVSIIGQKNFTVFCVNRGGLYIEDSYELTIQGITWVGCGRFGDKKIIVGDIVMYYQIEVMEIYNSSVIIQKNTFQHSMGPAVYVINSHFIINQCSFMTNNYYRGHGAAVYLSHINSPGTQIINNCNFSSYKSVKSIVYLQYARHVSMYYNTTFYNNQGVSIYLSHDCSLSISGDILFKNNRGENGAGIYISDHSIVIFDENSNVKFINNSVDYNGSAICVNSHSSVTFEQNSTATFDDNKAISGTICSGDNSYVTFKATSQVIFNSNSVKQYGAAICSFDNSLITFTGSSNVTFSNNVVSTNERPGDMKFGGIIFSSTYSHISFDGNSTVVFSNNSANFGTAIFSLYKSSITFKDRSQVMFNNNVAQYCGIVTSTLFSNIVFNDNTEVTFNYNTIMLSTSISNDESSAAAICTSQKTNIIFSGHSLVTFINNTAEQGGAVAFSNSNVTIEEYSTVAFKNNIAVDYSNGGAFVCFNNSIITIRGNSNITFNNNKASQSGGAIYSYNMCKITFKDNSTSSFIKNTARDNGGAILSNQLSKIIFEGNSTIMFDGNKADNGGAFYFINSTVTFKGTSMISFYNNKARQNGGVGYFNFNSEGIFEDNTFMIFDNNKAEQNGGVLYSIKNKILFKGNSVLTLTHNKAISNGGVLHFNYNSDVLFSEFTKITFSYNSALCGGAISANDHSNISVIGNSVLLFVDNEASQSGAAGYFSSHCNVIMEDDAMVTFENNKALQGGAVCFNNQTNFLCKENSTASFYNNLAIVGGGAVTVLTNSTFTLQNKVAINFSNNRAQYGAAIFLDTSAVMINSSDKNSINFTNNFARIVGNSIYQDVADMHNRSCLTDRVIDISTEFIATPPNELQFYNPAVCIDNDNDIKCNNYYIQNIMLGSEIIIPACVLDHYNHSVESTQFLIQGQFNSSHVINGPEQVLIGCNTFEGIIITGNQIVSKSTNLSVDINLYVDHNADWKQISVTLIVQLSECYPGFWHSSTLQKCECYNANDIVFCSGSSSTIKRGYWFGSVTGKPTVTFCPINYCNFTCCETSNGYYHLSPVRNDQCRSHRSGTACGSCKNGYTLSFDSTECLNVESCTAGQTVLVILLTVTYWIVMVILVFTIMYYKIGIGYLYCITYYYSIVDILLSQNLQASGGLYLTVSIISSFSKITPQFLGELCLTTGMSGIDQQFIHYIHPSAVVLIIVIISLLARKSSRFTAVISRGIIHVICLLLLLSYTSIASTSLLLMRSLTFHGIDKAYTYVSPDIEYFSGRHLLYGIVALLCSISIVSGLPLLLTLQPILNRKFNFVKIKPLLDQFQGCYKDNYRCFAGYYMICRLVIMTIIIANSSNEVIASYVLIVACGIIALIHFTAKPYNNKILNLFDGVVLQLIIFIAVLPLIDDFDSLIVTAVAFVLAILPLLIFSTLTLYVNKDNLKKIVAHVTSKSQTSNNDNDKDISNEAPMREFHIIIDDSVRQKAKVTICDM